MTPDPEISLLIATGVVAVGAGYAALLQLITLGWLRALIGWVGGIIVALVLTLITIPRPGPDNPANPILTILFGVGVALWFVYRRLRRRLEE